MKEISANSPPIELFFPDEHLTRVCVFVCVFQLIRELN